MFGGSKLVYVLQEMIMEDFDAVDAEINGEQYQAGNRLWFNNNGSIKLVDAKSNY